MIVLVRKDPDAAFTLSADGSASPSSNKSAWADQSASPLLALPAELRNRVWTCLLVRTKRERRPPPTASSSGSDGTAPNACAIPSSVSTSSSLSPAEPLAVAALQTCHQVYDEGLPILYGANTFEAHPSLLTALPLFSVTERKWNHVTQLRLTRLIRSFRLAIRLDTDPRFSARQAEEAFAGVEALELVVSQAMYGSCDFSVLKLFEGVRGIRSALVHGSVGDGRYAAWLGRTMMLPPGTPAEPFSEQYVGGIPVWHAWQQGNR